MSGWRDAAIEAWGLGTFMVSAVAFTVLLYHPASPVSASPAGGVRLGLMGLAMGLTAVAIIHSPWGRRSGAHLNPAVTLAFLRLGRLAPGDAARYVVAQFAGGLGGVALVALVAGRWAGDPAVRFAVTVPGPSGPWAALAVEVAMAFALMAMVLATGAHPRAMRWTGALAGLMVGTFIVVGAPVSGMSINPARTVASAVFAGDWRGAWIYVVAPLAGMLAAAEVFRAAPALAARGCAKLHHDDGPCRFCAWRAARARAAPAAGAGAAAAPAAPR